MFTANSMNCLTEALGLSLPGNGSTLATHAARRELFLEAGRHGRRPGPPLLRARTTTRCCRATIATKARLRERDGPRRRHGRLDQHRAAHPRRRPGGRARLHARRHRRRQPAGAVPGEGRAELATSTWRTCTAPAASPPSSASSTGPGCCDRDVHTVHSADARRVARRVGHPGRRAVATRRSSCSTPRPAGCAPPSRSRRPTAGRRSTPTPRAAASATSRTRTRPTAGWPCCAATSPPTAR